MHKTGSSSIQRTLQRQDLGNTRYLDWRSPNHSALFALLFHEPVEEYHAFSGNGIPRDHLLEDRATWMTRLNEQMLSHDYDRVLFSAEDISGGYRDAVARMAEFFRERSSDIEVIAYVRPPISFMQSAFQQRVRSGGLNHLDPATLWPGYRARFNKLDQIFGRANVKLKKFSAGKLIGGDVVLDIAQELGVNLVEELIVRGNESASLEAVALLFAQRHLGDGFVKGFAGAQRGNTRFISALDKIGTRKLIFAPKLVEPVIEANRADLDWIEERLGESLLDTPQSSDLQISSEADLLVVAEECSGELEDLLINLIRSDVPGEHGRIARNLNLLRHLHY